MVTGTFALERNIGGGLLFNASSTSGTMKNLFVPELGYFNVDWSMGRTGFGAFAFFGLNRFIEFNLGFLYKNPGDFKVTVGGATMNSDASDEGIKSTAALHFGVYGKYPFILSPIIVLFPTIGSDFELTLSGDNSWWHDLWFRGGIGLDFFFTETMFLRSHLIYGVGIPIGGDANLGTNFSHGLLVKLGLGWMF